MKRPLLWIGLLCLSAHLQAQPLTADEQAPHVLNRLAFGPRPGDLQRVKALGIERYIEEQLATRPPVDPPGLAQSLALLGTLHEPAAQLWREYTPPPPTGQKQDPALQKAYQQRAEIVLEQARQARLLRAIYRPAQLQEVMTDFWFNHFNVFAGKGLDKLWVGIYEEQAIRPYALGKFRDLLGATAHHPAMSTYLDNIENTAPNSPVGRKRHRGINENYAREVMELHTLGVNGGYTQQDVIALAHILTGWGYKYRNQMADGTGFYFDPQRHDFSDKIFLGHSIPGSGEQEGEQALDLLAKSPATARHISYQLAQYFVSDTPDPALVKALSRRWQQTDGDIREVLRTLFHSRQFWAPRNVQAKFKTPYQYLVSSVRASGVPVINLRPLYGTLQQQGEPVYGYLTPDGYKDTRDAWLNPDAMAKRLNYANALGQGYLPLTRPPAAPAGGMMVSAGGPVPAAAPARPLDPAALAQTLGHILSAQTLAAVQAAPQRLQAGLILASPEFMQR